MFSFFDLVWKNQFQNCLGFFLSFRIKFLSGANDLQLKLSSRPDTALVVPGTKMQKRRNKKKNSFKKRREEK